MDFKPILAPDKTVESEIVPFGTLNPTFNGYNEVSITHQVTLVRKQNISGIRPLLTQIMFLI